MAKNAVLPTELCFKGNMAENWTFFKQKFNIYMKASKQSDEDEETKLYILLNLIGDKGLRIYNTFKFEDEKTRSNCTETLKKFDEKYIPRRNTTYERHKFFTRNKKESESYEEYVSVLRELSKTCEFETLRDSLIRDKLILEIKEVHIKDILLGENDLTLLKALDFCKVAEITAQQLQEISEEETIEEAKVVQKPGVQTEIRNQRRSNCQDQCPTTEQGWQLDIQPQNDLRLEQQITKRSNLNQFVTNCRNCGLHHHINYCSAYGQQCGKCKKLNHFARVCRSVNLAETELETSDDENCRYFIRVKC